MVWIHLFALQALAAGGAAIDVPQAGDQSRLYAQVTLKSGAVHEGIVRWGDIEASWADHLNASREVPERNLRQRAEALGRAWEPTKRRSISLFGRRINLGESGPTSRSEVAIQFGHLRSLEPIDNGRRALARLKSGEEVELLANTSDLGRRVRLTIHDASTGDARVSWDEIRHIEFMATPPGMTETVGQRLFGVVVTRDGTEYTGNVTWDRDEVLDTEALDGEDESGADHEILFRDVRTIAREGGSRSRVTLRDGQELLLSGTNDVNRENRGILVVDATLGQIEIGWADFAEVRFADPAAAPRYADFDGGRPLIGAVTVEDGQVFHGRIRWDNDEEYTWEMLDGEYVDSEIDVAFASIRSIEKSLAGALVTLADGRAFEITGSNDVDDDNKGIFVATDEGSLIMVLWDEFRRIDFGSAP